MATVEDLAVQALARCADFGGNYPTTRSVLYRRLGVRQQQLYAAAARENPEYFGATANGILDGSGEITLASTGDRDATDPVPSMELISKIVVLASAGVGAPPVGTEIHVVTITDGAAAALPPRVTVRGGNFAPVGSDLAQVSRIRVFYSHRPFNILADDGSIEVELPEPFHDLLVVDLTRYMVRKMTSLTQEVREVALSSLKEEEEESLANFLAHVKQFTAAVERGRFGRTQASTKQ